MGKLSELLGETIDNEASYQNMVASLKLALRTTGMHNMFVGVICDGLTAQDKLSKLDKELSEEALVYNIDLDIDTPDFVVAIREKIESSGFRADKKAVFSIFHHRVMQGSLADKSVKDKFFGYLQRSYLRHDEHGENKEIEHPNILWIDADMLAEMRRKAPDYCARVQSYFYFDFDC